MPPGKRRYTQKDIASRAALSVAAVSMALKNHPSLPEETILRVKEIAKELEYRPDPVLSALVAHRNRKRVPSNFSVIGLVSNWSQPEDWAQWKGAQEIIEGATNRAIELGYSLQHIRVKTNAPESPQLTQILNTRGIRGLILAPFEHHLDTIDLEFDNFSIVTIEKPTLYPNFQYITQNHFSNVLLCWEKLRERNYTSVGLVVMTDLADRWHQQWEAAHNYALSQINPSPKPILILKLNSGSEIDSVRHWIREHKPQVVISRCDQFFVAAKQENLRIPEDIGYVSLNISDDHPEASGINQNRKAIGSIAIDALNGLLLGNQRGERTVATGTLVEGTWHEGDTLPSRG